MKLKTVAVLAFIAAGNLAAQWPTYKTTEVPRTPDGQPVLDGPAPKNADGHPDLSGVWAARGGGGGGRGGRGGQQNPPPATPDSGPPLATFFNVGAGFKEGLPLRPAAAELLRSRTEEHSKDNPDAHCLPLGLMQLHLHPQPRKMIQTPGVVVILYEAQGGVRQIFTDGRTLPPADVQPWWYGYSIGHWEGDTLVAETTGFRDDVWLDVNGSPLTNHGKMTERFRRINFGNLEIVITFEDPTVYTKPFTVKVNQRIMPDTDLIEFICNENDRSGPHLVGK
ncbi:MAG: hypothetical protein JO307_23170 [Bryobacterales bacterium]|nr:hypothetical protein [Bryobacterales bacterium]MBV9400323.1 hypothetical protein [Bryobacterales bacterium]